MPITIANRNFEGSYTSTSSLRSQSGVYAVLCQREGRNYVIDVGEAGDVKQRIENHDRKNCWSRNCAAPRRLAVAVLYTPHHSQADRAAIEREVRAAYAGIPCGER